MFLDLLFFLLFIVFSAVVIMAVMHFLVSHDFFLPLFLRIIEQLGGPTGRIVVAVCLIIEIILVCVSGWWVASNLARIGEAVAGSAIAQSFTLPEIVKRLGWVGVTLICILLMMSLYSIAIMIERYLTYAAAKAQSREFAPRVAQALKNDRIKEAINISDKHKKSHLAMVVNAGLQEFRAHEASTDISDVEVEASKRALRRAIAIKSAEFKRGLSGLATVGATAPFVGLFGTVFGIINAFVSMREAESTGISAVAGGIAEALLTTALGLAVAVPAVWLFNYFTGKVDGFIVEMDTSASELIDYLLENRTRNLNRQI